MSLAPAVRRPPEGHGEGRLPALDVVPEVGRDVEQVAGLEDDVDVGRAGEGREVRGVVDVFDPARDRVDVGRVARVERRGVLGQRSFGQAVGMTLRVVCLCAGAIRKVSGCRARGGRHRERRGRHGKEPFAWKGYLFFCSFYSRFSFRHSRGNSFGS